MKRVAYIVLAVLALAACKKVDNPDNKKQKTDPTPSVEEVDPDLSFVGTTYQLLVYSFADSNGDGIGDFNGIKNHLDHFVDMGVSALWLSPIHPCMSYHGYDVTDYYTVNPDFGTESDFQALVDAAHAKGIKIYLDYVLNHSGTDHEWFKSAEASESSEYRDYYIFSQDPEADIKAGKIAMIAREGSGGYNSGEWFACDNAGGSGRFKFTLNTSSTNPTITVTETTESTYSGSSSVGWNLYYGNGTTVYFRSDGSNSYSLVVDFESDWGFLVRKADNWNTGSKYGAKAGSSTISLGSAFTLYPSTGSFDPANVTFTDPTYFHSHFQTSWFADLNYGAASSCETSAAFKDLAASADKWIKMGVDGLRLDAVKHIYHKSGSDENPTFLGKWYDHCNATYQAQGHTDNIFMVGEVFNEYNDSGAPYSSYLKGLPSVFNFSFWWRLSEVLNNQNASNWVSNLVTYQNTFSGARSDAVMSQKLSNHDEDRTGSILSKSADKEKQAAAMLLTAPGKPFIYQGEELGYYGIKSDNKGDEYVRTPIKWTKSGAVASGTLGGKVDNSMLTSDISVEAQEEDASSILNVYKTFGTARSKYAALANGTISAYNSSLGSSLAAYYMTDSAGNKMLVIHNVASGQVSAAFTGDLDEIVAQLGSVSVNGNKVTLGGNSSVVFKQY